MRVSERATTKTYSYAPFTASSSPLRPSYWRLHFSPDLRLTWSPPSAQLLRPEQSFLKVYVCRRGLHDSSISSCQKIGLESSDVLHVRCPFPISFVSLFLSSGHSFLLFSILLLLSSAIHSCLRGIWAFATKKHAINECVRRFRLLIVEVRLSFQ